MTAPHLFCFGLGYSALTLAQDLLAEGWRVSGTCRTLEKCESLRPLGITAHIFDTDLPLENIWDLQTVTHILCSIPPLQDKGAKDNPEEYAGKAFIYPHHFVTDPILRHHLADLRNLKKLEWLGYLSTTGVYGDHQGGWVDEDTPVNPPNERSHLRVRAEREWLETRLPVHIFRLSGIYGPGRSVIDDLESGTAYRINKDGQVFSRIHVEDIVRILLASMANSNPGVIYNCADDEPAPQAEVVGYAAGLLGVSPPPLIEFAQADLSAMARSFWQSNRRIRNDKIKTALGVKLKYPGYRQGLNACLPS